jgi:amino acid transporter
VHPRFRTPVVAILVTAAVALVLGASGTFAATAAVSAVSRLLVYVATCASTLRLRGEAFARVVCEPIFMVPFGPVIPSVAILIGLAILAGASLTQLEAGGAAIGVGAALYLLTISVRERDRT